VDIEIRRIETHEWQPYRRLRLSALRDSPLAFVEQYETSLARPDEFWRDRVAAAATGDASCTVVAVHGGEFIGKASCFIEPDIADRVSAHVVGVYVTPRHRGGKVAEAVMAAVIRWAREDAGADRIRLFVLDANERAAAFYRRIGFVRTGATMAYPPDPTHTEYEMEYGWRA
jgi:RimJ/RimL family protein N-acetyltransferase